jgi:signal transduction histidine kinase
LKFKNNGPGIAEVDQARIFEKFIQGKQLNNKPQGTGLGLTISRKIVELHHGRNLGAEQQRCRRNFHRELTLISGQ